MSESQITHELPTPPIAAPPLDRSLWKPNPVELDFLRARISQDEAVIRERLFAVQEKCYEDYPYPCIRAFHFVSLMMRENEVYDTVLERGKEGGKYLLDLGCMMGTDLRFLLHSGYPPDHLIGADLRDNYIRSGFQLYQDEATCPIKWITGDMFDILPTPSPALSPAAPLPSAELDLAKVSKLNDLKGSLSFIYTGALFHLFDEQTQLAIALRLFTLWSPAPGGIIFGRHQGARIAGPIPDHMGRLRYAHSPESWPKMWEEVVRRLEGEEGVERVRVKAQLREGPGGIPLDNFRMLFWSVERV